MNRRSVFIAAAVAGALALAGCEDQPNAGAATPAIKAASIEAIKAEATGMTFGPLMAAKEVFVFFDPKCPHCAFFWRETEALQTKVKFTWIPVAILSKDGSLADGGALLQAQDKPAAMREHAAKVIGVSAQRQMPSTYTGEIAPAVAEQIRKNTILLDRFGATGVPYVVFQSADGGLYTKDGGMSGADLATKLGLGAN